MAKEIPDPRTILIPLPPQMTEMPRRFYLRETVKVARGLIGMWLVRRHRETWYGGRIVETEAYLGIGDAAAHSRGGRRTPRIEPMYLEGGHLYVFFVYGMHHCANVVTRRAGIPQAVLLRAAEGPPGAPASLMSGPGRLCAALGITAAVNGADLLDGGEFRLLGNTDTGRRQRIGISSRIGVDYAGEARLWPLRFFDPDSPAVSGPARLRRRSVPTSKR